MLVSIPRQKEKYALHFLAILECNPCLETKFYLTTLYGLNADGKLLFLDMKVEVLVLY